MPDNSNTLEDGYSDKRDVTLDPTDPDTFRVPSTTNFYAGLPRTTEWSRSASAAYPPVTNVVQPDLAINGEGS